jgi:hypothetical protein
VSRFFDRFFGERRTDSDFRQWPIPHRVTTLPIKWSKTFPALKVEAIHRQNARKYGNVLVIGLGVTGEIVLGQWLTKLDNDPAGLQNNLRVMQISQHQVAPLRSKNVQTRSFELDAASLSQSSLHQWNNQREFMYLLLRQAANYQPFEEYLHKCLTDLRVGIQVMIVGSIAEYEIGFLGPVLQAIRLASRARIGLPPSGVIALLALNSPLPAQSEGEIYAAMRETGRMTFGGTQWMEPPLGISSGSVDMSLLDHLFVVDNRGNSPDGIDLSRQPFESGTGRVMSEGLFNLIHPAGRILLDDINNVTTAEIRDHTHQAVVHGLGVASIYVPIGDVEFYAAARLAWAAIYGEDDNRRAEGFAARSGDNIASGDLLAELGRNWLLTGPIEHPFFEWLLGVESTDQLHRVPELGPEYKDALRSQLAFGLLQWLNREDKANRLGIARQTLRWLEQRFANISELLQQASIGRSDMPASRWFEDFLIYARNICQHFFEEVRRWEQALYGKSTNEAQTSLDQLLVPRMIGRDWWDVGTKSAENSNQLASEDSEKSKPVENSLYAWLSYHKQRVEETLRQKTHSPILHSALVVEQDDLDDLNEAYRFYTSTVRPELNDPEEPSGRAFRRVWERLGWWIEMDDLPRLRLVFAPAGYGRDDTLTAPVGEMLWEPGQMQAFAEMLLQMAGLQTRGLMDLTGDWFRKRYRSQASFLQRANHPLLRYDQQKAISNYYRPSRKHYLIGYDRSLTGECKGLVFPNVSQATIPELSEGEPDRLTALTMEFNVPLQAIQVLLDAYPDYGHRESLHIAIQEKIAVRYERRIRAFQGWEELPPDLVSILIDAKRVTLFCQGVFCGLIDMVPDELGQRRYWSVLGSSESYTSFPLAPADEPKGLLQAMRAFVLDLPNIPNIESQFRSPFHPSKYVEFVDAIWRQARECRKDREFIERKKAFEELQLAFWRQEGQRDLQARAFANLLQAELAEPVWKDW